MQWQNADTPLISLGHLKNWAFTSAATGNKKGITIRQASLPLFSVRAKQELIFDGLSYLRLQNNSTTYDSLISLYGASLSISNNDEVLMEYNQSCGTASPQSGGVIWDNTQSAITIESNKYVGLQNNSVCNAQSVQGGAITTGYAGLLHVHHNPELSITGNTATGTSEGYGGALFICSGSDAQFTHNGHVLISGNGVEGADIASGGAFSCDGNLLIAGNQSVTLEKNYEKEAGVLTLRSIRTPAFYQSKRLDLSAPENAHITIYDSIWADVNTEVHLNGSGTDLTGTPYTGGGDIIFSGERTKEHLKELLRRDATDEETERSRTSVIRDMTYLHAGRLLLQDGAILQSRGLTLTSGKGAKLVLHHGHLDCSGYTVEFQTGTALHISGGSSLHAQTLTFQQGSTLSFTLDAAQQQTNHLNLLGSLTWASDVTLRIDSNGTPEDGAIYALITADSTNLPKLTELQFKGLDATQDNFYWKNNTLYYQFKLPELNMATWSANTTDLWDKTHKNWQQGAYSYPYEDGKDVLFTDAGHGTLQLVGDLAPKQVLVNNSAGHDYHWKASATGGRLIGSMKLVKQGAGNLVISTPNTYTGGTELVRGTLTTEHPHALGKGDIHLLGGLLRASNTLNINSGQKLILDGGAAGGIITTSADSCIDLRQHTTYTDGTLTLAGGALQLNKHELNINGTLHLAGETSIDVSHYGEIGAYPLITWQQLTGDINLLKLQPAASSLRYSTLVQGHSLVLHVTGESLLWNKAEGIWSNNSPDGWKSGFFTPGEAVHFDNGGTATLEGELSPSSIRVSGNQTTRFTGTGRLSGRTLLTKDGSGTFAIETDNNISGNVVINEGTLVAAHSNALGTADIEINKGVLKSSTPLALKQQLLLQGGVLAASTRITPSGRLCVPTSGTVRGNMQLDGGSMLLKENAHLWVHGGFRLNSGALCLNRHSRMSIQGNMHLNGGTISLAYDSALDIRGSLTLTGNTQLILESGFFSDGDVLISTSAPINGELSCLHLVYEENFGKPSDAVYKLRQNGTNVVLYRYPDPEIPAPIAPEEELPTRTKHQELSLANWGIALASRVFVEALHDARIHTAPLEQGCIWMSGLGGYMALNDAFSPEIHVYGSAFGVEFAYDHNHVLGVAIGSTYGEGSSTAADWVEQTGTYGALYGRHPLHLSQKGTDAIHLHWSLAKGQSDSTMKNDSVKVSPNSHQADAQINWQHTLNERFALHLLTGIQYLEVSDEATIAYETDGIRNLRMEIGGGISWQMTDNLHLFAEASYLNDVVRRNPTNSRNPGCSCCKASVGLLQQLGLGFSLHSFYCWERSQHAIRHSGHMSINYSF